MLSTCKYNLINLSHNAVSGEAETVFFLFDTQYQLILFTSSVYKSLLFPTKKFQSSHSKQDTRYIDTLTIYTHK